MNRLKLRAMAPVSAASWSIESPTPGVVLINVDVEGVRSLTPLHWRAGDWTKPPLDIEVNPKDGAVQAVQVVLQDERVPLVSTLPSHDAAVGVPLVDVESWPDGRYEDERCSVGLARASTGELVVTLGNLNATTHTGLPGCLIFGWDGFGHLCELVVGPLTPDDWDNVEGLAGGAGSV